MAGIKKSPSALAGRKGDPTLRNQYKKAHQFGLNIAKFHDASNEKHVRKASELRECRTWFEYDHYLKTETSEATNKITKGYSCKNYSLCPSCAMARARKVFHQTKEKLQALQLPVDRVKLLTITVKNTDDFSEGLKRIRKFYSSMVHSRKDSTQRKFNINTSPFVAVDGWIGRYEVTRSKKDSSWHPHIHLLIVVSPEYTDLFKRGKFDYKYGDVEGFFKNEFSKLMADKLYKQTGDSFMVDCRSVKESDFEEKKLGSVAEVSKYLFKFGDLKKEEYWQVYDSTRGMRLGVCGGVFRGIKLDPDTLNDEEPKNEENDLSRIRYEMQWKHKKSNYRRTIVEFVNLPCFTDEEWKIYECDTERESRISSEIERLKSEGFNPFKLFEGNNQIPGICGIKGFNSGAEFAVALRDDPRYFDYGAEHESWFPMYDYRIEYFDGVVFGKDENWKFFCSVELPPPPPEFEW